MRFYNYEYYFQGKKVDKETFIARLKEGCYTTDFLVNGIGVDSFDKKKFDSNMRLLKKGTGLIISGVGGFRIKRV